MSTNNEAKPTKIVGARRSSLKSSDTNKLDPDSLLKVKNKRNSVSWGQSNTFQFKAMKAMFQESKDIDKPSKEKDEKHQKFVENRKKSIKNEFSIVKELMKNKNNIIDEEDLDDEVKKNTDKNVQLGKDALEEESESSSDTGSAEEDDSESEKENDNKEKEKEKE